MESGPLSLTLSGFGKATHMLCVLMRRRQEKWKKTCPEKWMSKTEEDEWPGRLPREVLGAKCQAVLRCSKPRGANQANPTEAKLNCQTEFGSVDATWSIMRGKNIINSNQHCQDYHWLHTRGGSKAEKERGHTRLKGIRKIGRKQRNLDDAKEIRGCMYGI